ncbi:ROK family protein [Phytoactinopolyspora sp. XMNu-373]|uniref:ROK family protein n=1 Tax=Phytoactinopolyspora mesophila TaxID=2650750 RepID=A0A7K3M3F7_9ACTN|nr:ROK family protein [Phytoactinopolyspora mesophila]
MVALDVGGTWLKGAALARDGTALTSLSRSTGAADGPEAVIEHILDALVEVRDHPATGQPAAVGLAVPGIVDVAAGRAVWSENLRWKDVPIRALAEERTGLPVALMHDVRAGGLAESQVGAAAGHANVLFVPIGTGVAAAIIVDGRILDGQGMAGELGHVDVGHTEPCACGGAGCLEAIASAAAIARRYSARSGIQVTGAADVLARKQAGDPDAGEVWAQAVDALALALAIACSLLAPEVIVLGGGLAQAGPELFKPLSAGLSHRLTFQRHPRLVPATLGDRAGCIGAGMMAQALIDKRAETGG